MLLFIFDAPPAVIIRENRCEILLATSHTVLAIRLSYHRLIGLISLISVDHLHPKYTNFPTLSEYDIVGLMKQVPCVDSAAPEAEAETGLPELRRTEMRPPHRRHGQEGDGRKD